MSSVGELVAAKARKLGMILFVDVDGIVWYYPKDRMPPWFFRLLSRHYHRVKYWLITEAITVE